MGLFLRILNANFQWVAAVLINQADVRQLITNETSTSSIQDGCEYLSFVIKHFVSSRYLLR